MSGNLVALSEIAEVKLGRQRSPKNHNGDQMRPYVRAANVGWNGLKLDDVKTMNFTDAEMRIYRLLPGDILLGEASGSAAEVGKPAIWAGQIENCGFQNTLIRVRPRGADSRYLLHYFAHCAASGLFARRSRGVGIFHLGRKALAEWPIPIPPIEEQRRIAAVLDAADALRAKRREALAKLDTLTQAIFIDMFGDPVANPKGWPVVRIGEALASATYGTSKKAGRAGEFAVLRMGNLTGDGRLDLTDLKYIDLEGRELDNHLAHSGDVLFNRTNSAELVGKTAVYRGSEPIAYAGYLVRLRPGDRLDAEYLGAFMNLRTTKQTLRAMCKSIVGMANINAKEVQTIEMPLPPVDLQRSFASARERSAVRRRSMESQAAQFDTLFAALQQRAFRGEL
ncbi:restriction endonuclease subunit S [Ilumatobacter sp.]|uniref:restriction endonuclease subunit S n=1 Tax=Ilumatobacter sp. TaxID=1967498 RepID=UPI0037530D33